MLRRFLGEINLGWAVGRDNKIWDSNLGFTPRAQLCPHLVLNPRTPRCHYSTFLNPPPPWAVAGLYSWDPRWSSVGICLWSPSSPGDLRIT